jgi:hypothetical protein
MRAWFILCARHNIASHCIVVVFRIVVVGRLLTDDAAQHTLPSIFQSTTRTIRSYKGALKREGKLARQIAKQLGRT